MIIIKRKIKYIIFSQILILFLAVLAPTAFGQRSSDIIISDESDCERIASYLDMVMTEISDYPGSSVILIARLGDGEKSRKYNERRLIVVKTGINRLGRYPAEKIITTQGERVQGKGQVEVYLGGRLFAVFKAGRGKNLQDPSAKECAV